MQLGCKICFWHLLHLDHIQVEHAMPMILHPNIIISEVSCVQLSWYISWADLVLLELVVKKQDPEARYYLSNFFKGYCQRMLLQFHYHA